jgi:hypothetical protein
MVLYQLDVYTAILMANFARCCQRMISNYLGNLA